MIARLSLKLLGLIVLGQWWIQPAVAFQVELQAVSQYGLENPHDVKLSPAGDLLFVSDVGNDQVVVLNAQTLAYVDAFGDDHQDGTHDVDFDSSGRLYVADTHNNRVGVYEMSGARGILDQEYSEGFSWPEGVLVHPNGTIYITGARSGNIVAFENGSAVAEAGGLSSPHDIEVDTNGDLWIADAGNDRLVRMSPSLEVLQIMDDVKYDFRGPRYLDIRENGSLIIADKYSHSVKVISPDGTLIATIRDAGANTVPSNLTTPEGVELMGNQLWIADSGNDRILRYRIID